MAEPPPYPGTPRWVKVFGIVIIIVVLLFGGLKLFGADHGPGRHAVSDEAGGQAPRPGVIQEVVPSEEGRG